MADIAEKNELKKRISIVRVDGPYLVRGGIPLVRKLQVVSEYGEPLTWKTGETIPTRDVYALCRCGASKNKPFCDGSHKLIDFDSKETAVTNLTVDRQVVYPGGTNIIVRRDHSLCAESGFCGNRFRDLEQMVPDTYDTQIRLQVMAMIEHCPSGSFTYSLEEMGDDIEPDLPQQIAVTTEISKELPIAGPLWVTGGILIERADGQYFETRNRVTLCRCGRSQQKPLCDGTHRKLGIREDE